MGLSTMKSFHLEGAESEKIVPAGHNLIANPATVTEIKRILEENIAGRDQAPTKVVRPRMAPQVKTSKLREVEPSRNGVVGRRLTLVRGTR